MNDLYASLQRRRRRSPRHARSSTTGSRMQSAERELISGSRRVGSGKADSGKTMRPFRPRENGSRPEKAVGALSKDLERREAKIASETVGLGKREEAVGVQGTTLEDRRDELARATERMEKIAKELAARDRKVGGEERRVRQRHEEVQHRERELAAQERNWNDKNRQLSETVEELTQSRPR